MGLTEISWSGRAPAIPWRGPSLGALARWHGSAALGRTDLDEIAGGDGSRRPVRHGRQWGIITRRVTPSGQGDPARRLLRAHSGSKYRMPIIGFEAGDGGTSCEDQWARLHEMGGRRSAASGHFRATRDLGMGAPARRGVSHLTADSLSLSIVIPAFNEAARLMDEAQRLHRAVVAGAIDPSSTELIVVDDGSSDDTAQRSEDLFALSFPEMRVLRRDSNSGKGAAIRDGVAVARAPVVAFMDADMAVDPQQLPQLVAAVDRADIAIGSRSAPGSSVQSDSFRRAIMGRTFSRFVNVLTEMGIRDTQCGFKAFRTPVARLLFHGMLIERFAFDVELLHLARRLRLSVAEVPIHWRDVEGSAVRPVVDPVSMVIDVLRMRLGRKPAPMPALSVSVRAPEREQFDEGMPAALFDAFGQTLPVLDMTPGCIVVLLPLAGPGEVHRATMRISELVPEAIVREQSKSLDELIDLAPMPLLGRDGLESIRSDGYRALGIPMHGATSEGRVDPDGTNDQEPLSLPGT